MLEKWELPSNHHKSDAENFTGDTGITFKADTNYFDENPIKTNTSSGKSKKEKETRSRVLEHVHQLHTKDGLKFTQIYDKLSSYFGIY